MPFYQRLALDTARIPKAKRDDDSVLVWHHPQGMQGKNLSCLVNEEVPCDRPRFRLPRYYMVEGLLQSGTLCYA